MKTSKFLSLVTVMTVLGTTTMFGSTTVNNNRKGDQINNQPRSEQRVNDNRQGNMNQGKDQQMNGRCNEHTFVMQPVQHKDIHDCHCPNCQKMQKKHGKHTPSTTIKDGRHGVTDINNNVKNTRR